MKVYNEIISKSLIDFEELKFVLANNNVNLVNSKQIKETYFLNNNISFKTANYKKILENSYVLLDINEKLYLAYQSYDQNTKSTSSIEINNREDCIEFLNHAGFNEILTIEKNVYDYNNGENNLSVINLINVGLYLSVKKENSSVNELKQILDSFNIPYKNDMCDESIEKVVINKVRRYI